MACWLQDRLAQFVYLSDCLDYSDCHFPRHHSFALTEACRTMSFGKYCRDEATLADVVNNPHLNWDYVYLAQNPRLTQEWLDQIPQLIDEWYFISYNKGPGVQNKEFLTKYKDCLYWYKLSQTVTSSELVLQTKDLPWFMLSLKDNDNILPAVLEQVARIKTQQFSPDANTKWKIYMLHEHGFVEDNVSKGFIDLQFNELCSSSRLDLDTVRKHADKPWNFRRLTQHPKIGLQWILTYFPNKLARDAGEGCFDIIRLSKYTYINKILRNSNLPWCWTTVCKTHSIKTSYILSHPDIPWDYNAFNMNSHFCIAHALTYKEPVWKWDLNLLAKNHGGPDCSVCSEHKRANFSAKL